MYQRQFNRIKTKQVILADIFNTLKDKGYNTNEPIRIPDEMEDISVNIHAFEKYLDVDYILNITIAELESSAESLIITGFNHDNDEECNFEDAELDIESLSKVLDFVEDMPETKNTTYHDEAGKTMETKEIFNVVWESVINSERCFYIYSCATLEVAKAKLKSIKKVLDETKGTKERIVEIDEENKYFATFPYKDSYDDISILISDIITDSE